MTNEQKINAILELARTLTQEEIRDLAEFDFDDLLLEKCKEIGHTFVPDHCGREEHNFCTWCYTPKYSKEEQEAIKLAREAKVVEAADCNPALPSESLGSGSIFSRFIDWLAR